ncbi:MAG: hypothetical protein AB1631_05075 [Acidobacteriota bacterium]
MPEQKTIVVSIMSPGVGKGGGGFVIVNGKLRRIPPHSPRLREIEAAINLMVQQEDIADKKIRSQLSELTDSLISANVKALVEESGK